MQSKDEHKRQPIRKRGAEGLQRCPICGRRFVCGLLAGQADCWCADLPHVMPLSGEQTACLCPDCLENAIRRRSGHGNGGIRR